MVAVWLCKPKCVVRTRGDSHRTIPWSSMRHVKRRRSPGRAQPPNLIRGIHGKPEIIPGRTDGDSPRRAVDRIVRNTAASCDAADRVCIARVRRKPQGSVRTQDQPDAQIPGLPRTELTVDGDAANHVRVGVREPKCTISPGGNRLGPTVHPWNGVSRYVAFDSRPTLPLLVSVNHNA